jgi:hypothetical protein
VKLAYATFTIAVLNPRTGHRENHIRAEGGVDIDLDVKTGLVYLRKEPADEDAHVLSASCLCDSKTLKTPTTKGKKP